MFLGSCLRTQQLYRMSTQKWCFSRLSAPHTTVRGKSSDSARSTVRQQQGSALVLLNKNDAGQLRLDRRHNKGNGLDERWRSCSCVRRWRFFRQESEIIPGSASILQFPVAVANIRVFSLVLLGLQQNQDAAFASREVRKKKHGRFRLRR